MFPIQGAQGQDRAAVRQCLGLDARPPVTSGPVHAVGLKKDLGPQSGGGHGLRQESGQRELRTRPERFVQHPQIAHSVGAEIPVIGPQAAPGDQVPPLQVMDQSQRLHGADLGGVLAVALVGKTHHPAAGQGLLQAGEIDGRGRPWDGRRREGPFEAQTAVAVDRVQHGPDLGQGRIDMPTYGFVAAIPGEDAAGRQGIGLFLGEIDRRHVVAAQQGIAHPGLGQKRHAEFAKGA